MRKIDRRCLDRIRIIRSLEELHEYGRDRTGAQCETAHLASRGKNRMRNANRHPLKAQGFFPTGAFPDRTDQAAKLHTDKRTDYDIVGDEDRP